MKPIYDVICRKNEGAMKPGSNQREAQTTAHLTKNHLSGCQISQKNEQ